MQQGPKNVPTPPEFVVKSRGSQVVVSQVGARSVGFRPEVSSSGVILGWKRVGGSFSGLSLLGAIRETFPDYEVDQVDGRFTFSRKKLQVRVKRGGPSRIDMFAESDPINRNIIAITSDYKFQFGLDIFPSLLQAAQSAFNTTDLELVF